MEVKSNIIKDENYYRQIASKARKDFGLTNKFSFGDDRLDDYCGGGYGKDGAFEIVLIGAQCLAGDTKISCRAAYNFNNVKQLYKDKKKIPMGHPKTIKWLYEDFQGLKKDSYHKARNGWYIESVDERDNSIVNGKIKDVIYSGKKHCYKITTKLNKSITTTNDHRFLTFNGWKRTEQLSIGDNICIYGEKKSVGKTKRVGSPSICVNYHPSANLITKKVGKYTYKFYSVANYRLMYEAEMNNMTYDEYVNLLNNYDGRELKFLTYDLVIHHKDRNPQNNSLENLQVLTKIEHDRLHAKIHFSKNRKYHIVEDEIVSIEDVGIIDTYDIICDDEYHNFRANDFVAHNTGLGKSTFVLNMAAALLEQNIRFCLLSLEDDGGSTLVRLENIIRDEEKINKMYATINKTWFLRTEEDVKDEYTIDEALDYISKIYDYGVEVVFLDHIQFFVESIDRRSIAKMDDNNLSRYIHRKLNHTVKLKNKTLVLVSHVRKGEESENLNDMFLGSSALAQAATKILYLKREKDSNDIISLQMTKTRYTKFQTDKIYLKRDGMRLNATNFIKEDLDI